MRPQVFMFSNVTADCSWKGNGFYFMNVTLLRRDGKRRDRTRVSAECWVHSEVGLNPINKSINGQYLLFCAQNALAMTACLPGHVVWWAGRVVPCRHAGVHAVGALQAQGVVWLLSGWRGLVVQDGVVNQRRTTDGAVAQRWAVGHDWGVGGRRGAGGHEVGLRAVQRLPLTLSFGRCPLFELSKATTLLLDHLLTCREEGTDQSIHRFTGRGKWNEDGSLKGPFQNQFRCFPLPVVILILLECIGDNDLLSDIQVWKRNTSEKLNSNVSFQKSWPGYWR